MRLPFVPSLFCAAILMACNAPLAESLTETQANDVLVALDQHGIGGTKVSDRGQGETPTYSISVAAGDVAGALAVLRAEELPRKEAPGLSEVFKEASLVPTATEEKSRYAAALAGELARSLETIGGVLHARVHVALPDAPVGLEAESPRARAAVLIKRAASANGLTEEPIRRLVAGAVQGLAAEDVAVVFVNASTASKPSAQLSHVGPFAVSRGSATALQVTLAAMLVANLVLAAALVLVFLKRGRSTV